MVMSRFVVASAAAVLGVSSVASADFFIDQPVTVIGAAGPQFGGTSWGTNIAGGTTHLLGTSTTYPDAGFPAFFVVVTSVVNNINSLTITMDFSNFSPGDFDFHAVDITGLKQDGSIIGVTASQGIAQIFDNGNSIHWDGSGPALALNGIVTIEITQIPTPGAAALVGLGGLIGMRRRR